ncbi:MAG: hypothetical protein K0Q51_1227 [Rickettsiaceae bacterium]|jgi:hypothetical protein|nr:hypothetical protein [Rickettsiaceae bacterium]
MIKSINITDDVNYFKDILSKARLGIERCKDKRNNLSKTDSIYSLEDIQKKYFEIIAFERLNKKSYQANKAVFNELKIKTVQLYKLLKGQEALPVDNINLKSLSEEFNKIGLDYLLEKRPIIESAAREALKEIALSEAPANVRDKVFKNLEGEGVEAKNLPSLEELHKLYHDLKEFKKAAPTVYKNNKGQLRPFKNQINTICRCRCKFIVGFDKESIEDLFSKDPKIIAKKIFDSLAEPKLPSIISQFQSDADELKKVIIEYLPPKVSHKATEIWAELNKLTMIKGKAESYSFSEKLLSFCRLIGSLFNSKYRVKDSDLKAAFADIEKLRDNRRKEVAKSNTSSRIFGKHTEEVLNASQNKGKGKNHSKSVD